MARVVGKFHKGQAATQICLCGEHKPYFFLRHFRRQVNHTLDILDSVPVAVAVAQPAVNKGSRPGPDKSHKAVVGIPGVYHGVKFRAWCGYREPLQFLVPVFFQCVYFLFHLLFGISVGVQNGGSFRGVFFSQQENYGFGLTGSQGNHAGEGAAGIFIVA